MTESAHAAVVGPAARGSGSDRFPAPRQEDRHPWSLGLPGRRTLEGGRRPLVMGIVNLTPDSFSDGGRYASPQEAATVALEMLRDGADVIDLGAESTRPGGGVYGAGAAGITWHEEWQRLKPVLSRLREATDSPISVDTRKAEVASRALAAGADLINDVSCLGDPEMAPLIAATGAPIVLMHSRGDIASMQKDIAFEDVVGEVEHELKEAIDRSVAAGIARRQIIVDPGLGFGKTYEQNLQLLAGLSRFRRLGRPIVIGASRKSFLGHLTGEGPAGRLAGSLAAAAWAAGQHADIVRVHDVAETTRLLKVWNAIAEAGRHGAG